MSGDGGRNGVVAPSVKNPTLSVADEGDAVLLPDIQMKDGFSRSESSRGKSTIFK